MPPRPSIDADDEIVADLLASTLELIAEAGGWVDPTVVLVERAGQLSLRAQAPDGAPLVDIPVEAMVRVDAVTWADDDSQLAIEALPDDLGDLELQMLFVQMALHNQTGKLPWLAATHPALAADLPDDVIAAVRRVVPSFRTTAMTARDVLWANRCFRLPLDASHPRVLVPIVDLLNHHRSGATGRWDGRGFSVTSNRPFGTAECALDYGMERDALEMGVVYGFADSSARLARSAPLTVPVPDVGEVRVAAAGRAVDGSWLPVEVTQDERGITISHLTVDLDGTARAIHDLVTATGWDASRTADVVRRIARANIDLLDPVVDAPASCVSAQTLSDAARRQRLVFTSALDIP